MGLYPLTIVSLNLPSAWKIVENLFREISSDFYLDQVMYFKKVFNPFGKSPEFDSLYTEQREQHCVYTK